MKKIVDWPGGQDFQLVVLDLLSVIRDSADVTTRILGGALRRAQVDVTTEEVRSVLGLPLRRAVAALFRTGSRLEEDAQRQDRLHDDVSGALYMYYRDPESVREIDGTSRTFANLRAQGLRLALATNVPRVVANAILTRVDWIDRGLVDTVVTCDDVENPRPQPGMIVEAMLRTGVLDARRVLKVGQTPADLAEGTLGNCGAVVGLTSGAHSRDDLYLRPHTHLVDRIAALSDVVALAAVA